MIDINEERIKEIEWAYAEMQKRGWGFASDGAGFGDPAATFTIVGPYDGVLISALAFEKDCVEAVKKAIQRAEGDL